MLGGGSPTGTDAREDQRLDQRFFPKMTHSEQLGAALVSLSGALGHMGLLLEHDAGILDRHDGTPLGDDDHDRSLELIWAMLVELAQMFPSPQCGPQGALDAIHGWGALNRKFLRRGGTDFGHGGVSLRAVVEEHVALAASESASGAISTSTVDGGAQEASSTSTPPPHACPLTILENLLALARVYYPPRSVWTAVGGKFFEHGGEREEESVWEASEGRSSILPKLIAPLLSVASVSAGVGLERSLDRFSWSFGSSTSSFGGAALGGPHASPQDLIAFPLLVDFLIQLRLIPFRNGNVGPPALFSPPQRTRTPKRSTPTSLPGGGPAALLSVSPLEAAVTGVVRPLLRAFAFPQTHRPVGKAASAKTLVLFLSLVVQDPRPVFLAKTLLTLNSHLSPMRSDMEEVRLWLGKLRVGREKIGDVLAALVPLAALSSAVATAGVPFKNDAGGFAQQQQKTKSSSRPPSTPAQTSSTSAQEIKATTVRSRRTGAPATDLDQLSSKSGGGSQPPPPAELSLARLVGGVLQIKSALTASYFAPKNCDSAIAAATLLFGVGTTQKTVDDWVVAPVGSTKGKELGLGASALPRSALRSDGSIDARGSSVVWSSFDQLCDQVEKDLRSGKTLSPKKQGELAKSLSRAVSDNGAVCGTTVSTEEVRSAVGRTSATGRRDGQDFSKPPLNSASASTEARSRLAVWSAPSRIKIIPWSSRLATSFYYDLSVVLLYLTIGSVCLAGAVLIQKPILKGKGEQYAKQGSFVSLEERGTVEGDEWEEEERSGAAGGSFFSTARSSTGIEGSSSGRIAERTYEMTSGPTLGMLKDKTCAEPLSIETQYGALSRETAVGGRLSIETQYGAL